MFDDDDSISENWPNEDKSGDSDRPELSFRRYAICHWAHHLLKVTDDEAKSELDIILKKFVSEEEAVTFQQWLQDVKEVVELKGPRRPTALHLQELESVLNDSNSPLFFACVYGLPSIFEQMKAEVAGSERKIDYDAKNINDTSAIYISARYGPATMLKLLLENGANADAAGGLFGNALQAAAFHGHLSIVLILLEWGADVFASGKFNSALEAAMSGLHEKVIMVLLKVSNLTQKDDLENVLQNASFFGHNEIVEYVLKLFYTGGIDTPSEGMSK